METERKYDTTEKDCRVVIWAFSAEPVPLDDVFHNKLGSLPLEMAIRDKIEGRKT